jgi:hypothetical protein
MYRVLGMGVKYARSSWGEPFWVDKSTEQYGLESTE